MNNIYLQKQNQILCEQKHVNYNRSKLEKQIEKIEQDFQQCLQDRQISYDKF